MPTANKSIATIKFSFAADAFVSGTLALNEHLVNHPAATFFFRAGGDLLQDVGALNGGLLIIDGALTPKGDSIVVATLEQGL